MYDVKFTLSPISPLRDGGRAAARGSPRAIAETAAPAAPEIDDEALAGQYYRRMSADELAAAEQTLAAAPSE